MIRKTMDGNEAAANASYLFTEVAAIYPITPSSPMAEAVDKWAGNGRKNMFGQPVKLVEMQSEAGAVSSLHGTLMAGSLGASYTASQGLMLMIPTMYRIAGQLRPGVIHVASRNVATHGISIFAEHSDVMACRQTGFALLVSSDAQQALDLSYVAHLSAIKGSVPFLHFFDGFRTSHEIRNVCCPDEKDVAALVDQEALARFQQRSLNPEHPLLSTAGLNGDTYFQSREAANRWYDALPDVVEEYMGKINALTGSDYHLFNYYGAPDAEYLLVGMGSVAGCAQETVDYLNAAGGKVGYVEVHLYRPFSAKHLLSALPESVKRVTVLDRTKEPGAAGEPLFEDVCSVLAEHRKGVSVLACRYGLAGKDVTPAQLIAVVENMKAAAPRNHVTVGIEDDITGLSLAVGQEPKVIPEDITSCKFWGLGSDGTVGANKNTIKIIGDHTDLNVQAYFEYDGKKSGGVTKSHLRFGKSAIRSTYLVNQADFVACHNQTYVRNYDLVCDLKEGGSLLLNCTWTPEELSEKLPAAMRRALAEKKINLYIIDAADIAREIGLGSRTNTVLQSAFFRITGIIPMEKAVEYMKAAITKTYGKKGEKVLQMNYAAVDRGAESVQKVEIPESWLNAQDPQAADDRQVPDFISHILEPVNAMRGNDLPVSEFMPYADGMMPQGTSKYEKRGIAPFVPKWDAEKCIQCNQCSYVCPHAAIRPFLLTEQEAEGLETAPTKGKEAAGYRFRMQVLPMDCQGCGSCVNVCPAKEKAIAMVPTAGEKAEEKNWEKIDALPEIHNPFGIGTVKGSQFQQPLLEFSGACAGCGETPYAKLITQLFGDRMYVATATGCSQVWATSYPSFPYTTNKQGCGPAVAGSLFENNAEFGLGIHLAVQQQRKLALDRAEALLANEQISAVLRDALSAWKETFDDSVRSGETSEALKNALAEAPALPEVEYLRQHADALRKKSVWMFGGDGWAYDIGYGGLDHVLASGENVNVLVMDTEVYSNTGGQTSKATPTGAVAQFAAAGKRTKKKDLGVMAMSYGDVYVAQVAMGASQTQLLKALTEAEAYNGPSLIIAYAPCINHGLRAGMNKVQDEIKRAVDVGYWHLYRYNPTLREQGKNPFVLDSKEPTGDYLEFLRGEVRYTALERTFPDLASDLFEKSRREARERYEKYRALAEKAQ